MSHNITNFISALYFTELTAIGNVASFQSLHQATKNK